MDAGPGTTEHETRQLSRVSRLAVSRLLVYCVHVVMVLSCKITELAAGGWQTNQPLNVTFQSKKGYF